MGNFRSFSIKRRTDKLVASLPKTQLFRKYIFILAIIKYIFA